MSHSSRYATRLITPLGDRLAEHRPILTCDRMIQLGKRLIDMTTGGSASVSVTHTVRVATRMADGAVLSSDDGDELEIEFESQFGEKVGMTVTTNQLDDSVLRDAVHRCETLAREQIGLFEELRPQVQVQDQYVPVTLWNESTVAAMSNTRATVLPEVIHTVHDQKMRAGGFVGLMAKSHAVVTKEGVTASYEETDSEVYVTARTPDGKSSGWSGAAHRDWSRIDPLTLAREAAIGAERGIGAQGFEPGRRTVILTPAAVAQLFRFFGFQFDAYYTDLGMTVFSRPEGGNRVRDRVMDPAIRMSSDPADPDGGYAPFFKRGYATPARTWVDNGVLQTLSYNERYGPVKGVPYSVRPYALRVSGGESTIDQMIASCELGVFVNRFSSVDLIDYPTMQLTGVTRDGCFLIKNGKLDRPLKNFRFVDSPMFMLNSVEALGVPQRASFGYTPPGRGEGGWYAEWPRPPIVVPPMMIRDFNFTALAEAV